MMITLLGKQQHNPRLVQDQEEVLPEAQDSQGDNELSIIIQSSKIEFPKFHGKDLKGWLFCGEQFFDVARTPLKLHVKLATIHPEREALQWHQVFMRSRLPMTPPSWEEYILAINEYFGGEIGTDPMIELMHLRHKGLI
ncbi:hypothetical protein CDL12_22904 [Handroanthus impetiginosus]|uniref:Retrotransposon gag domain-containing protein n=1 Tax=Handroanthus impetiginosus TaxID=429701 RepID=A0A2G9GHR5_9LAMI|nr:hypothetical protein CDL12_22904 [Handroanthus impetiginosus]